MNKADTQPCSSLQELSLPLPLYYPLYFLPADQTGKKNYSDNIIENVSSQEAVITVIYSSLTGVLLTYM